MIYINSFIHFVHLKPVISCKREGCNQEEPALENFDILAAVAAKFNLKFKQQCPLLVAEEAKYDLSVYTQIISNNVQNCQKKCQIMSNTV